MASIVNNSVAVAIVCKTPIAGQSKTRLSPPLSAEECAALSACFIRDVSSTIAGLAAGGGVAPYALYTPVGTESTLRPLLPGSLQLLPQGEGDLGTRLIKGTTDLFAGGHAGIVLVNSDAPTLPLAILYAAVDAVRRKDDVALSMALDGGYTLIGLSRPHVGVFERIPWSTAEVYRATLERARELALSVTEVPAWYDVDDAVTLQLLVGEFAGRRPALAHGIPGAEAPATRAFLRGKLP